MPGASLTTRGRGSSCSEAGVSWWGSGEAPLGKECGASVVQARSPSPRHPVTLSADLESGLLQRQQTLVPGL